MLVRALRDLGKPHLYFGKPTLDRAEQDLALFCQGHGAPAPLEQLRTDMLFKVLDLIGNRRLRHVQFRRRISEAAQPCRGLEGDQGAG